MPQSKHQQHIISSGHIHIVLEGDQRIPAYWSHPVVGGPFPGLVLLHDEWGTGANMRAMVYRFAEVGYYVMAPDLFDGYKATDYLSAQELKRAYEGNASPKVDAAIAALKTHRKTNSKTALVGWGMGAEIAFQIALERKDIVAIVGWDGQIGRFSGQLAGLNCPALMIYGEQDTTIHALVIALRKELSSLGEHSHQLTTYPVARRGFYNEHTPTYDEETSQDAWLQTCDFLELHQGKPPAPDESTTREFRPGRVY